MNLIGKYDTNDLLNNVESESIDLDKEENIEDEVNNDDKSKRKLYVDKVDKSTSDLFRMILEKELNLQPDYQREFVWTPKIMSKFIESLLLSIPIPTIFLAENDDDTFEVIDGQQRLTTIFVFMKTKLAENDINNLSDNLKKIDNLVLNGLDTLKQFNSKSYADFSEDIKRKFNNVSLPVVIIKKDSSEDIKYDIFSRINSGSVKLNSQELLNVMYRGKLLESLNEIASSKKVDDIFGRRPILKKRFGYHEILLRARAMEPFINSKTWSLQEVAIKHKNKFDSEKEVKKYNGRLNTAIIEYLKEYRDDEIEAEKMKKFLDDAIDKVNIVFGEDAFKRVIGSKSTSINKTIAELQLIVLSKLDKELIQKKAEVIKKSFFKFIEKNTDIFTKSTNNTSNVEKRYKWGELLLKELKG